MKTFLKIHLELVEQTEERGVFTDKPLQEAHTRIPVNGMLRRIPLSRILDTLGDFITRYSV